MANPKTASEKHTQYQNDNFNVWVQKTNIVAREEGDLNSLSANLLSELQSQTTKTGTVAGTSGQYTITGTSTTFLSDYAVGDTIKIIINTTVHERPTLPGRAGHSPKQYCRAAPHGLHHAGF